MGVADTVPRVLFVDHIAAMGGGEIALLNLVRALDRSRYEPVVLLMSDGPLRARLQHAGIETHLFALPDSIVHARKDGLGGSSLLRVKDGCRAVGFCVSLAKWIRAHRIALVHTNSLKSDFLGGVAGRLAGVPVVWHVRDRIENDYLPAKVVKAFRLAARWLPTRVVANSAATLRTVLPADVPVESPSPRWRVVHDGTPWVEQLPVFAAGDERLPLVGIVGRISPWKGQHIFLRAAAAVRTNFPDARFRIIGSALFDESAYEQSLHALCKELGLESAVEFVGFRADVMAAIADLDVLVHASTTGEPFGQVVIEAMVMGKPVIATRGGGVPEIVVDGVTGVLVPMGDAEAVAEALVGLLSDPARRAALGRAGRQRVDACFRIERVAAEVAAVYGRAPWSIDCYSPNALRAASCTECTGSCRHPRRLVAVIEQKTDLDRRSRSSLSQDGPTPIVCV